MFHLRMGTTYRWGLIDADVVHIQNSQTHDSTQYIVIQGKIYGVFFALVSIHTEIIFMHTEIGLT